MFEWYFTFGALVPLKNESLQSYKDFKYHHSGINLSGLVLPWRVAGYSFMIEV